MPEKFLLTLNHFFMSNQEKWNSDKIIKSYLNETDLQKPEKTIFNQIKEKLPSWRILDIGVGTGRTTLHLAYLAKEYVGIDVSQGMIEICKKKFQVIADKVAFHTGNVCCMYEFKRNYFDFVLFSYNGIDYISHEEREIAFREIIRVSKPGAQFVFSTHNLNYIHKLYSVDFKRGWRYSLYQCYRYLRVIFTNGFPGKYKNKLFAVLNDGAHHFSLKTYYCRPRFQIEQLKVAGFTDIRLFSLKNGEEISIDVIDEVKNDSWIYYWCRVPQRE